MILEKFTLREAFEKRLLELGECVNIEGLYTPYKTIPVIRHERIATTSLESFFRKGELKEVTIDRDSNGAIIGILTGKGATSDEAKIIASKLLSDSTYNIKATYKEIRTNEFYRSWEFSIELNPDIIVSFEGEEEIPHLQLPPNIAYTV